MRSVISPVLSLSYGFVGFCKTRWFFAWKREEIPLAPVRQTSFRVEFMGITGACHNRLSSEFENEALSFSSFLKCDLYNERLSWSVWRLATAIRFNHVRNIGFMFLEARLFRSDVRRSSRQIELLGLQNEIDTALGFIKEGQDATKFTLITKWFRVRKRNHLKLPVVVLFKGKVFKSANKNL